MLKGGEIMYWTAFIIIGIFVITPGYLIYRYFQDGHGVFMALAIGILIFIPGFLKHIRK
jgi:hypothetical protein